MSHSAAINPVVGAPSCPGRRTLAWWQGVVLLVLVSWLYSSILAGMVFQWAEDPDLHYGFAVLPFSLLVVWRNRDHFMGLPAKPSLWGLAILLFALGMLVIGSFGAELFLSRLSFLFVIAGLLVLYFGWNYLRAAWFPLVFLVLMIPVPAIISNPTTMSLQLLASKIAAAGLPLCGIPVLREGNIIYLPALPLEVAKACSGIRYLSCLVTLAAIYGYLVESSVWIRVVLFVAAIPLAILANSVRIIGTGILVQHWDPEKASGFVHEFSGLLLFLISLGMLILLHKALLLGRSKVRCADDL